MDIRGRSNYPFRAPLTGPRLIPPSGRPCVGLTRLSTAIEWQRRKGERGRENCAEGREGGMWQRRKRARIRRLAEERKRRRKARGKERVRETRISGAEVEGGERKRKGGVSERGTERERRERGRRRGVAGCCCRACADKGNLRLQSLVSPSRLASPPPPPYAHTRASATPAVRTYAHTAAPACNPLVRARARTHIRTHACMPRAAETAKYSPQRKRRVPRISRSLLPPLLLRIRASTSFFLPAPLAAADSRTRSSTIFYYYSSSSSSSSSSPESKGRGIRRLRS